MVLKSSIKTDSILRFEKSSMRLFYLLLRIGYKKHRISYAQPVPLAKEKIQRKDP